MWHAWLARFEHGRLTLDCSQQRAKSTCASLCCSSHACGSAQQLCAPGLQTGMLTLQGSAVALAAEDRQLAIVFHRGLCQGRDQNLAVVVLDMAEQSRQVFASAME